MRIVRYRTAEVAAQIGVLTSDGVAATPYRDMVEFIAAGDTALAPARRAADGPVFEGEFTLLAPLPNPGKMLFLGRSFRQFRANLDDADPVFVYSRVPSSVVGPGDAIRMPGPDEHVLYEAELLIVIGRTGRRIAPDAAMDHVFGYTQVNDITWTDWIHGSDLPQITLSKNADTFCPMGPYIVTADAYDPYGAGFTVTVNGEVRTRAHDVRSRVEHPADHRVPQSGHDAVPRGRHRDGHVGRPADRRRRHGDGRLRRPRRPRQPGAARLVSDEPI